jgi:hypothetical protein
MLAWSYDNPIPGCLGFAIYRLVAIQGINLPDPAGIAIAGRPDENLGVEVPEMEGFWVGLWLGRHGFSLKENGGLLKWIEDGLWKAG